MKKILYICTAFYPENAIGSIRNTKLVKYLIKLGYDVTVISPELDANIKMDKTLYFEDLNEITHINISYGSFFRKVFLSKRNKIKNGNKSNNSANTKISIDNNIKKNIYQYTQEVYTLIRNRDWKKQVIGFLEQNSNFRGFDYVISGYPSLSTHLIGEYIINNRISKKWICDFRDPIAYESLNSKLYYLINKKLQKRICQRADAITHVTENMKISLSDGIEDKRKFHYLPNGFDNDDLEDINKSKINSLKETSLSISYVGGLYNGKRDLSQLFRIIRILIDNEEINENNIKFYYAGKEFNILKNQASKFELEGILVNKGSVAREDSLAIQDQSDIVVVSTWNTEKDVGVIPGKIYECFLLKKPTITITNGTKPNSELGSMVKKSGLGVEVNVMHEDKDEEERLKKFILDAYNSTLSNTEFKVDYNTDYINRFNYENITEQLIQLIEGLN